MPEYKVICPHCGKSFALSEYAYHTFVHKLDLKLLICSECGNRIEDWYSHYDPSKSIFDYPVIIWNDKRDKSSQYYFSQPDQWLGRITDIAFDYDPVCQHDVCRIRFYNQTERNKQFYEWIKDHMSQVCAYPLFIAEPIYAPPIGLHADKFPNKFVEKIIIQRILGFALMIKKR